MATQQRDNPSERRTNVGNHELNEPRLDLLRSSMALFA